MLFILQINKFKKIEIKINFNILITINIFVF